MLFDLEPYIPMTVMLIAYAVMFSALFWHLLGKEYDKHDK